MSGLELTWLGQAGFSIRTASASLAIDLFLSPHPDRVVEPPSSEALDRLDWLLATHDHLDHLDLDALPGLVELNPELRLLLPAAAASAALGTLAPDRIVGVEPGDLVPITEDVQIDVLPAFHADDPSDGYGAGGGRYVGYRVVVGGFSIYHSGDTLVTDALLSALRDKSVDVAILPINGRDFFRERKGFAGNMDVREAAAFAHEIGAHVVVPMHWDAFAGNTVRPGAFVDAVVDGAFTFHVLLPARGAPLELPIAAP